MTVVNPNFMNVTEAATGLTEFKVQAGTATGGPYTASSATVPIASFTLAAGGVYSCPFSAIAWSPALANSTPYFCVSQAVNAGGTSGNSPEASFSLEAVPPAPSAMSFT